MNKFKPSEKWYKEQAQKESDALDFTCGHDEDNLDSIIEPLVKWQLRLLKSALHCYRHHHPNTGQNSFKEVLDIIQLHLNCK